MARLLLEVARSDIAGPWSFALLAPHLVDLPDLAELLLGLLLLLRLLLSMQLYRSFS